MKTTTATATLTKWGNSQGLIIPKPICEALGVSVGDKLDLEAGDGNLSIRPQHKKYERTKRYTIDELFEGYDGPYKPPSDWPTQGNEIDWGAPVGKEMW